MDADHPVCGPTSSASLAEDLPNGADRACELRHSVSSPRFLSTTIPTLPRIGRVRERSPSLMTFEGSVP